MTVTDLQEQKTPLSLYTTNVKHACFRKDTFAIIHNECETCLLQRREYIKLMVKKQDEYMHF